MSTTKTTSAGFALESGKFASPPIHVPDADGGAYKTELVVERGENSTTKINWIHADDPRSDPHNHPWPFESTIESGGYTEDRWLLMEDGSISGPETRTYQAGDINNVPYNCFHVVYDVQENTRTTMRCGALTNGGEWGHLVDGQYVPVGKDPTFIERLRAINPHLRK